MIYRTMSLLATSVTLTLSRDCTRNIDIAILSVCLSVCMSVRLSVPHPVFYENGLTCCHSFFATL